MAKKNSTPAPETAPVMDPKWQKRTDGFDDIKIVGFWDRGGSIQGDFIKRVQTGADDVFYLVRLHNEGVVVQTKTGNLTANKGDVIGVGSMAKIAPILDEVAKQTRQGGKYEVMLVSKGKKPAKGGKTFWDIDVYTAEVKAPVGDKDEIPF